MRFIGSFDTAEAAGRKYDKAAVLFGREANFGDSGAPAGRKRCAPGAAAKGSSSGSSCTVGWGSCWEAGFVGSQAGPAHGEALFSNKKRQRHELHC